MTEHSPEELESLRRTLDQLDSELVAVFEQRMDISRRVAAWKLAHQRPVLDPEREARVLDTRASMCRDPRWAPAVRQLYETIMALSCAEQEAMMKEAEQG